MKYEKPRPPRHRVLKAASITFGGGSAIDCIVRNLSDTGAALEVASPVGIPNEFVLIVASDWYGARNGASASHFIEASARLEF